MDSIRLNSDEKAILMFFKNSRYGDIGEMSELSPERRSAAAKSLQTKELILANFEANDNVASARMTNAGEKYVDINPTLDDPESLEIERLHKDNLILQNNDLEHKARIRKQEDTIRLWQLICAIAGIDGFVTGSFSHC